MNVENILNKLLLKRGIAEINHYQDFNIMLITDKSLNGLPSSIRLYIGSEWYLNSKEWWDDFVAKFPIDTSKMAVPYEPVKAFALHLLGQGDIYHIQLNDDNSLEILFFNTYKLIIPSKISYPDDSWMNEPEFEMSWVVYAEETDFTDLRISCDGNGKMHISSGIKSFFT
jgi:hypothetical protein